MNKKIGKNRFDSALEIGCFTGKNIENLENLSKDWSGIEFSREADELAQKALPDAHITTGRFPDVTIKKKFDAIFLFDVLEHIKEPEKALQEIRQMLSPGGLLIITVPAYHWLWSDFDVLNQHYRRYTAPLLFHQLQSANFTNIRAGYYNTFLFIPAVIERFFSRLRHSGVGQMEKMLVPAPFINNILCWIFSLESCLVPKFPPIWFICCFCFISDKDSLGRVCDICKK